MTDIFVDSNASGANDGTSFADAFTTLNSAAPSAGDRILVANNHSETFPGGNNTSMPATYTSDADRLVPILSVDTSNNNLSRGAAINRNNSTRFTDGYIWYGFDFTAGAGDNFIGDTLHSNRTIFRDCTWTKTGSTAMFGAAANTQWEFYDCTFTNNGDGDWFNPTITCSYIFRNCVFDGTAALQFFRFNVAGGLFYLDIENCDFSGATSAIDDAINLLADVHLFGRIVNCRFPTGMDLLDRSDANVPYTHRMSFLLTDNATSTDPNIAMEYHTAYGVCETDTSRTRTGGASDGTTDYSWQISADSSAVPVPGVVGVESPPISVFVEGGSSTTVTINIAHDGIGDGTSGDLTDQELWIEGYTPDTGSPAGPAKGAFTTVGTGAAADLSNNSEAWGGTGVGTRQEVSHTFTPTEDGYVTLRVHFAPVDATGVAVSVCPKPEVS